MRNATPRKARHTIKQTPRKARVRKLDEDDDDTTVVGGPDKPDSSEAAAD